MTARLKEPIAVISLYPSHDETVRGILESRASTDLDRPFVIFREKTWSYREFRGEVSRTARMLAGRGITKGDRLGVMAPNSDSYVLVFFALARLGAILVPVNPDFGAPEAGYVLKHAEVSAVACTADTVAVAREASSGMAKPPWFMLFEGSSDPTPSFSDLLDQAGDEPLPEDVSAEDICLILCTSGTTGFPKGVMHSQRNFVMAGEAFVERMYLQPEDRLLIVLPLFHINALFYSLGGTLASGASLVLVPKFSASGFWKTAAETGATEVNIIAAVGNILARRPRSEFVPNHKIVKVYGAPISNEIDKCFRNDFNIPVLVEGYGMTEIPGACNNPFNAPKIGSMGKPARHPDHSRQFSEIRVVDDDGNEVPDGETGELVVRTPIIMKGYYRDPEQTAAAFRDGWFLTGDLGYRAPDGYINFVARKKDIIRKRGENISGAEPNRVVGQHPKVLEAAAIAVPSELGEDEILIAVLPKAGEAPKPEEIAKWCADHLAPIKMPRYLALVDSLPHTPTHRVAKFKLKNDPTLLERAIDLQTIK